MSRSYGYTPLSAEAPAGATSGVRFAFCPDPTCGAPAEVYAQTALGSTGGAVPHARTFCLNRHFFLLPVDRIPF